jgi:taurine dioxygenase
VEATFGLADALVSGHVNPDIYKVRDGEIVSKPTAGRPPLTEAQKAEKPPVVHPMVVRHPFTGRKCLYADPGYTVRVLGLSERESDELLEYLFEFQVRPEFQYRHKWRVGDVLIWDNIATIHMATGGYGPDEHRLMLRTQVLGDPECYRATNRVPTALP